MGQSCEPASFARFGSFSGQYGENAGFFLSKQAKKKKVIHLKLLELGGSFTAVFTGSYFCRTEGAVDVNLLLVRISFRVKGCTGRSAVPGQAADGTAPGSDPPDHTALLAPSNFLQ